MSAPDHLGPQWFHGSSREFKPGDEIQAAHTTGATSRGGGDRVWVSTNAWVASKYGAFTYPVEVRGTPKKQGAAFEHHVDSAVVTGPPVDNATILKHPEDWMKPARRKKSGG